MSNYEDDEIEIEIGDDEDEIEIEFDSDDLVASGEFSEPIEMEVVDDLGFSFEDEIDIDEIIISLHDGSSFIDKEDILEEPTLMIDVEDIEVDISTEPGHIGYELALTPAQNAVAIYKPRADENFELDIRNKEIHNSIVDIGKYEREAYKRLREYLESPRFDFFPKFSFSSQANKGEQDFRSLMISQFIKLRSVPDVYNEELVIKRIVDAYVAERLPELSQNQLRQMEELIKQFLLFASSTFDEAQRATELITYQSFEKEIICPELIGNKTYVCKCGEEYEMPQGRPTLTFLLRQVTGAVNVRLMNTPIPCPKCEVYLAIPTALADILEVDMTSYVQTIRATYEQPRIYRPAIQELEQMIPSEVKDLFQLSATNVVESTVAQASSTSVLTSYKKLINMWMNTVTSSTQLEKTIKEIVDRDHLAPVANQITRVDFGFVTEVYASQFLKTLIHYLQGDSLFALTYDSLAFYEVCELDGYKTKPFPKEFALKWLKNNAPYLASLNNLYDGDTNIEKINILPEYVEVLNYILGLHLLAKPELLKPGSTLGKWYKNPSGEKKKLITFYDKAQVPKYKQVANSHRDLRNDSKVIDPLCWQDSYYFFKHIVLPSRFEAPISKELNDLAVATRGKTMEEFYGEEIPTQIMIRPVYHLEEFMEGLEHFGYKLFQGVIMDKVRLNLAIGIENLIDEGSFMQNFKSHELPVTDITQVLFKAIPESEIDYQRMLAIKILSSVDLPEDLSEKRDADGIQFIVDNFDEFRDIIHSNEAFMKKFGDAISCL